jgi:hypothetical protein
MKRFIPIIILLLLTSIAYWYFKYVSGWMEFRKNTDTPKEFLNHAVIKKEDYSKDSMKIIEQFQKFLTNHQNSFYNKEYFDSTELIIDTILYSPEFNKLAIFVLTKNPTYRQFSGNKKYHWYYDGYCYLSIRQKDTLNLKWLRRFYPINWYDREEVSNKIREDYFIEFATLKDTHGVSQYNYNLNDKRFWECPVWDEYFRSKYDSLP